MSSFRFSLLIVAFTITPFFSFSQPVKQYIHDGWTFSEINSSHNIPAYVPGNIYMDLFKNRFIDHPFYGTNEKSLDWVTKNGWTYRVSFTPSAEIFNKEFVFICFDGLDTWANIYLNGELIASTSNMFLPFKVNIKNRILQGENRMSVDFLSPVNMADSLWHHYPYRLPDHSRVMARKAQYHFGWDWGPTFPSSGIWKDVYLEAHDGLYIEHLQFITHEIIDDTAVVECLATIYSAEKTEFDLLVKFDNQIWPYDAMSFVIEPGRNTYRAGFSIPDAKLWWPNGMGEQHLYQFECSIYEPNGKLIDSKIEYCGIRTIELIQEPDEWGESFYFSVNGTPVFIKGANYIPIQFFSEQTTDEEYEKIIKTAASDNMNMLRVWGGGIYEKDIFYELCDRYGIMIWQDFMFACGMYPFDAPFIHSVKQEAVANVERLRNHPCIALWCGNNESDEGWHNWGWQKQFRIQKSDSIAIFKGYKILFENILPRVVDEFGSNIPYHPSSPSTGWGKDEAYRKGDVHYWGVWWGMRPFESYITHTGRFVSEYGFQSLPHMQTLVETGVSTGSTKSNPILKAHQKHPKGFETIDAYMEMYAYVPAELEDYVYVSQYIQLLGMQTAIETHRRARPMCMGTLFWQLNDCWPVVSWSATDYYGRKKAFGYHLQRLYAPLMLSMTEADNNLQLWGISDYTNFQNLIAKIDFVTFDGKPLHSKTIKTDILAGKSQLLAEFSSNLFSKNISNCFIKAEVSDNKNVLASAIYYPAALKNQKLPDCKIQVNHVSVDKNTTLSLSAPCLCRFVELSYNGNSQVFSENYFDLLPRQKKEIVVFLNDGESFNPENIKIRKLTNNSVIIQ